MNEPYETYVYEPILIQLKGLDFYLSDCHVLFSTLKINIIADQCFSDVLGVKLISKDNHHAFKYRTFSVAESGTSQKIECTIKLCQDCTKERRYENLNCDNSSAFSWVNPLTTV